MSETTDGPGSDPLAGAVEAIVGHVNEDHAADVLLICRTLGGRADATAARMVGLDVDGATFAVDTVDAVHEVRVPWAEPIRARAQVRTEMVAMVERARRAAAP